MDGSYTINHPEILVRLSSHLLWWEELGNFNFLFVSLSPFQFFFYHFQFGECAHRMIYKLKKVINLGFALLPSAASLELKKRVKAAQELIHLTDLLIRHSSINFHLRNNV